MANVRGVMAVVDRGIKRRRALALFAGIASTLLASTARAGGGHKVPDLRRDPGRRAKSGLRTLTIPLTVHLAASEEHPASTMLRLERGLEQANRALERFGVKVKVRELLRMPGGYNSITRRRDRRRIASYATPNGSVHLFMVDKLKLRRGRHARSVRGLHWRYRGLLRRFRKREYVVVSGDAPSTTLIHEIGHLFGLSHSESDENLMCSCRRGPRQIFTREQGAIVREGVRAFLRS